MLKVIKRITLVLSLTLASYPLTLTAALEPLSASCAPCVCRDDNGRLNADCSNRNLEKIPMNLPSTIIAINLDDNDIGFGDKNGLCDAYKNLKTVTLARNQLNEVHHFLKGCETLEKIDLTGNTLTPDSLENGFIDLKSLIYLKGLAVSGPLKREVFSPLKNLQCLDLTYDNLSFPVDLFTDLKALNKLHLNLAKVIYVDDAPLKTDGLDELCLFGPKIKKIPSSFFSNLRGLTTLDLELPQLTTLKWPDQDFFSLLRHLSIKSVWHVYTSTLSGMKSLQTLQLVNIDDLEQNFDVFADQRSLEVLEITGCDLVELQPSWFYKLESLYDLNLTDNKLTELQPGALIGLSNLKNIVLSLNKLKMIPQAFWDPVVENLENISLNGNRMTHVQKDDFPVMNKLVALDISANSLNKFDLDVSQQMPNLMHLQLQYNSITNLTGSLGSNVCHVNISYNALENVPDGLFGDSLIDLDLSGNLITLDVDAIMRHEKLKELTIKDLTVKCDCVMQQLVKSKAVHGGKCKNDENEMRLQDVGDILNEPLCDDSTSTTSFLEILDFNANTTVKVYNSNFQKFEGIEDVKTDTERVEMPSQVVDDFITTTAINESGITKTQIIHLNNSATENESIKGSHAVTVTSILLTNDYENFTTLTQAALVEGTVAQIEQLKNASYRYNKSSDEGDKNNGTYLHSEFDNVLVKEQNVTDLQFVLKPSKQNVLESSSSPSDKKHRKETPPTKDDASLDLIVFPIVAILIIIIIAAVLLLRRHARRTGSHRLDHDRMNMASEECKTVMTELGKTQPGHVISIM